MAGHLTRVRARVVLPAHRKVRGLLEGEYAAVQTGRGMDFNDLRAYVRGDDVKDLDWKASARSGQMLVRRYVAERKHTVLLAVSTGRGMAAHHDLEVTKRDLGVLVAGLVGWLAVRHGDLVGLAHGDAAGCHGRPPVGGELHLERCLAAAYDATTTSSGASDLTGLLRYVARTVRRRTILLVVCEDEDPSDELAALLRRLAVQHEVLVVSVGDLDPTAVPSRASAHDVDARSSLPSWLRGDLLLAEDHARTTSAERAAFHDVVTSSGCSHARVAPGDDVLRTVLRLLERHRHARRR